MKEEKNKDFKNMLIGFGVILLYFIMSAFSYEFASIIGINYNKLNITFKEIYSISYEIMITLIIIYIYKSSFIPNVKKFIRNFEKYFRAYIKYWVLMIFLMIISNSIITTFTTTEISNNQNSIIETLKVSPIYTIIITVIIAPVLEELVFRLSFKKIFAHTNFLFIFFSGLFFGAMHVLGSSDSLIDFLFIIPYSIPGFIFSYIYSKSDNIAVPISMHMLHNFVMMLLEIFVIFVK